MKDYKKEPSLSLLFRSTLTLSAFTFGGGYVMVPLMREKFVEELGWIEEDEMLDLVSIAQSSPGAMAVNASIIVGYRMFGLKGALLSVLGTALPPLFIITVISGFYEAFNQNPLVQKALKGMQLAIAAIIVDVVIDLARNVFKDMRYFGLIMMLSAFVAVYVFKVSIALIILISALVGLYHFIRAEKSES